MSLASGVELYSGILIFITPRETNIDLKIQLVQEIEGRITVLH